MTLHRPEKRKRRAEVVLVVLQRLLDALAYSLVPGKVNDRLDLLVVKEAFGAFGVAKVEGVHA